jgi:glycine oxidase
MSQVERVIVIGAGVIGAASAWRLAEAGFEVTLYDRDAPGSGASQAALGVLGFHHRHDMPLAFNDLARHSRPFYPSVLDELESKTGRRPAYRATGQLSIALTAADLDHLKEEFEINRKLGVPVEQPTIEECQELSPGLNPSAMGALFWPENAWVDNTALTFAFVAAAEASGAQFKRGHVGKVLSENGVVTGVYVGGDFEPADWVVLAAGCWSSQIQGLKALPIEPVRGQALSVAGQPITRIVMTPRGYLVPKGEDQTMIGATKERVGYDESNTMGGLDELIDSGLEISPGLKQREFLGAWAGLRPGTPDDLPLIGPLSGLPNLIVASGHYRNGILLAPLTASLVRALITGETPLVDVGPFSPDRFTREE